MPDPTEYADVEILDDEPAPAAAPPEQGAAGQKSTGSPQPVVQISPQARHSISMVAGVFGLCGFTAVCVVGLAVGLPGTQVLLRAVGALFLCWFVGVLLSQVMLVVIREHLQRHHRAHPRPERPRELDTPAERARRAA